MHIHPETFVPLERAGDEIPPYRPTHDLVDGFIDSYHRWLAACPIKDGMLIQIKDRRWFGTPIPGWLRREDALKLYELAYFSTGDILELGCYQGLSTSILARATLNSGRARRIDTVDLDPFCTGATRRHLRSLGLDRNVTVHRDDATAVVARFAAQGKRFGFVFIDHSHVYQPVYDVCRGLADVTAPGGFCLFHDFNDSRNRDPNDHDYGVYQAVTNGLDQERFQFCGIYGCTGLYRAVGNKEAGHAPGPMQSRLRIEQHAATSSPLAGLQCSSISGKRP